MGLLDDAIREHLELKRRRGADPAEVARAEQEALGPVRREPEPAAVQDSVHEEPADVHLEERAPAAACRRATAAGRRPRRRMPTRPRRTATRRARSRRPSPTPTRPRPSRPRSRRASCPRRSPPPSSRLRPPPPRLEEERDQLRAEPPPHAAPDVHAEPASETATPPHGDPAHDEPVDPRHSDIVHQPTTEWRIEDEDEPFADEQPAGRRRSGRGRAGGDARLPPGDA